MGITAEKLYEIVGRKLKGSYCLLIPDMGNHGKEKAGFLSAEDEAEKISTYLKSHEITELVMIYGASIEVRPGYNHCEYMMKKNADYVSGIENVIRTVL